MSIIKTVTLKHQLDPKSILELTVPSSTCGLLLISFRWVIGNTPRYGLEEKFQVLFLHGGSSCPSAFPFKFWLASVRAALEAGDKHSHDKPECFSAQEALQQPTAPRAMSLWGLSLLWFPFQHYNSRSFFSQSPVLYLCLPAHKAQLLLALQLH